MRSTLIPQTGHPPSDLIYDQLYRDFRWKVPANFNIAAACAPQTKAQQQATALIIASPENEKTPQVFTYTALWKQAQQAANGLRGIGVQRNDRVAIILPQCAETAIAHLGCFMLGAVSMPMSILFGPDALAYRIENSECRVIIVEEEGLPSLHEAMRDSEACAAQIRHIIVVSRRSNRTSRTQPLGVYQDWQTWLNKGAAIFTSVNTRATDPAVLIYTSGTTGAPKGALIPHQALIGNLTGFVASQNWTPQKNDVFWSPADWAWTGGLMDALLPCLYFKIPIIGYRGRFSAELAFELLEQYRVTNTFLFPTALKQMMKAEPAPLRKRTLHLRAIMSAGESVGETLFDWTHTALNVITNEMFGQTEVNYIVGNSAHRWPARAGSIGKAYPGHQVAVIDDDGNPMKSGELGEVAVNRFDIHGQLDPVFFLGYWKNPQATQDKFSGNWCRTGDLATQDDRGYLWYGGRADDMFKAAGYRIGPGEIENCLVKHPLVANVAVIPKPDLERGNVVKAFVVLVPEAQSLDSKEQAALIKDLQNYVRGKLAPYEYPKEVEFIDALPMTTTGKVQRRILRLQEAAKHPTSKALKN